jgi:linoleoyl-CoA desaturase
VGKAMETVDFAPATEFWYEINRRVKNYFVANNLKRNDNFLLYAKAIYFLSVAAISYAFLLVFADHWWSVLGSSLLLAYALLGIGFNIQHDANHGAFSRFKEVNRNLGMLLDVLGLSSWIWKKTHNLWHHMFTNVPLHDGDMEFSFLVRLSPYGKKLACHRYQHLYIWLLYALAHPSFFVIDYIRLLRGKVGTRELSVPRGEELVRFVVGKILFLLFTVVVPLWARFDPTRPWASIAEIFGVYLFVAVCLGVGYQIVAEVAHIVSKTFHPDVATGRIPMERAVYQLATTANFAIDSWFWNFHLGGLNFQAAHHLFYGISHVHYPALWKIIKEVCDEYGEGYEYHEFDTFWEAIVSHYRFVKAMAA